MDTFLEVTWAIFVIAGIPLLYLVAGPALVIWIVGLFTSKEEKDRWD
jgi:hypothetical protein